MKKILNKTSAMKRIETNLGGEIEEILRAMYVDKHMSIAEIQSALNLSYVTVHSWLRLAGVRSRRIDLEG